MRTHPFLVASCFLAVAASLTACGGDSEASDGWQSKKEVAAEVKKLRADTELPPGGRWNAQVSGSDDDRYQTGAADAIVLDEVQCEWYAYWLDRTEAADDKSAATALKHFATLHDMPAFKANDVSYREVVQSVEDAAGLGDPSGIQAFVRDNCGGMQEGSDYR
ncbi:hypothetical protein [Streptomyces cupreus]|uniref:Lipoprotein n=1 Tax=Streptomyces cupreus TaxID=2759956 RepID=A0A7X1J8H8_9ACTN|nr:hypothetical protein [Streptomyces cupreus]MBC2906153.1 hypothetical protein [Streptomyces cupreus]